MKSMKDILKIMRFDFITVISPMRGTAEYILAVFMFIIFIGFPLFIFPVSPIMYTFLAGPLIVPLQSYAEKSGFNKLYGILPVKRKSITRARFLYIFLAHLVMEAAAMIMLVISVNARLYEKLPLWSALMEGDRAMFSAEELPDMIGILLVWFVFLCFTFAFMEMYGQIHGRQHEMKVLFIMIGAVCVIVLGGVFILGQFGYPELKMPDMPLWILVLTVDLAVLAICVLFGEITAAKLSKREL